MQPVTAIIPTKNEARHLADAIRSLHWAAEILVVDSYSQDETTAIARQLGARVLERTFDTHARQKNWAIEQASYPWVFILDADERVPAELAAEITCLLAGPETGPVAYWVGRLNYFMGQPVRYSGWQYDKVIRLIRRDRCRYADVQVHEEIVADGTLGQLKNKLIHYTYSDLRTYLEKWDRYTWLSARDRDGKTKTIGLYHLAVKPLSRFFRHYIWFRGFLDGRVGFIISYLAAVSVFMRYLKLWRIREEEEEKA